MGDREILAQWLWFNLKADGSSLDSELKDLPKESTKVAKHTEKNAFITTESKQANQACSCSFQVCI